MPEGWAVARPIALGDVELVWSTEPAPARVDGSEPESEPVRPWTSSGQRFASYSEALGALAPPTTFENRPCYRLVDVSVGGGSPRLTFTCGSFFDVIDVCEAVAHELAQAARAGRAPDVDAEALPFRSLLGDPCDLTRRIVIPAISVLTIRRSADGATFLLHRRDPAKVAHGGGLHQVVPVGVFQPTGPEPWNETNDFDLLRSIGREYSEELLGQPELAGTDGPIAYDTWPFFRSLHEAHVASELRLFWLGLGIDPLSLVADLLVVAVFDGPCFDRLFGDMVATNAEGTVVTHHTADQDTTGIPFASDTVAHYADHQPMQAAGAALLRLAWQHREVILTP
jgi:hypothetical protein